MEDQVCLIGLEFNQTLQIIVYYCINWLLYNRLMWKTPTLTVFSTSSAESQKSSERPYWAIASVPLVNSKIITY